MREAFADVFAFQAEMGQRVGVCPEVPDAATVALRRKLIEEEVAETLAAMRDADLVGVADGIADAIYVLIGTAIAYGIQLPDVWAEVHASNMRKVGGPVREDGKRGKPDGWVGPDVAGVLRAWGWEGR